MCGQRCPLAADSRVRSWQGNKTDTGKKPTMKEVMQSKVKDCARRITGDDTPRKLEPEIRKKVASFGSVPSS